MATYRIENLLNNFFFVFTLNHIFIRLSFTDLMCTHVEKKIIYEQLIIMQQNAMH